MSEVGPILVVAAHPDDEVLGCGGTIARFASAGRPLHLLLMADGETSRGSDTDFQDYRNLIERRRISARKASDLLGCSSIELLNFPDNKMDKIPLLEIVKKIEEKIELYMPTTIFTHHAGDVNVDHRLVHHAVLSACRTKPKHPVKELLFFEIMSSTEWCPPGSGKSFNPNYFVDISDTLNLKLSALKAYESELCSFPHPRSVTAVEALARMRGSTVGVLAAEAFILGRKVL